MRRLAVIMLILLSLSRLSAIGFGYHILEVETEPDFASGVFPSSVMYQFDFPVPDLIAGSKTMLAFRLDNGLEYRRLNQHPDDGSFLAMDPPGYPRDYTVLFDEFNLFFSQGFLYSDFSSSDIISLLISIDGRFENAYERLSWMSGPDDTEGVFGYTDSSGWHDRFPDSSWAGAPELSGERSMFQTSISLGMTVNWMRDRVTRKDGALFSLYARFAPDWMPLSDKTGNYAGIYADLDLAATILSVEQGNGLTWFTVFAENRFSYRILFGDKVPQYALRGDIWGDSDAPALLNAITNRLSLVITGPQIYAKDLYPRVRLFWDAGISFGPPLNSISSEFMAESVGSCGARIEFIIYNIAELYYEIGYVYDPAFSDPCYMEQSFGFRVGI